MYVFLSKVDTAHLPDVLARVGEGDLVDLVGVEPDLALSALEYGGGKPLLELQRYLRDTERERSHCNISGRDAHCR